MAKKFQSNSPAMPAPMAKAAKQTILQAPETLPKPAQDALQAKTEALAVVQTLQNEVAALMVSTEEDYQLADQYLGRIRTKRKWWLDRMEAIIRPIRGGLDNLYALNREVDKPLEMLETGVKRTMADYKNEERRRLQAAEADRLQAIETAQRQAELLARGAAAAPSKSVARRLDATRAAIYEKLETLQTTEAPVPVIGLHSNARAVKKWRIKNLREFLAAVGDGTILPFAVKLDEVWMNKQFRECGPEEFAAWPGIEVYEDTQVGGR